MNEVLDMLIESRYKGIEFKEGINYMIGVLPHQVDNDDWAMVYERELTPTGSKKMILWIYYEDYNYFSNMIPMNEEEILDAVKKWFHNKTGLIPDIIQVQ